jgi:hypothetical protein
MSHDPTTGPGQAGERPLRGLFREGPERYGALLYLLFADVVVFFALPTGKWWAFFGAPFVAATLLLGLCTTRVRRR